MSGLFCTIEGIDGSGKSTQTRRLAELLQRRIGDERFLLTREPGDWSGGSLVRELLLQGDLRHDWSEVFLFLADRCEHVRTVVEPALRDDRIVLCERYCDSTLAYQGWGRHLPREVLNMLFSTCGFPVPDITLWIDVPADVAYERVFHRGRPDRMERDRHFLERVRTGYEELCRAHPARIRRIDGLGSEDEVADRIRTALGAILP